MNLYHLKNHVDLLDEYLHEKDVTPNRSPKVMSSWVYIQAAINQTDMDYDQIKKAIQSAPETWVPGLFVTVFERAIADGVLTKAAREDVIRKLQEAQEVCKK